MQDQGDLPRQIKFTGPGAHVQPQGLFPIALLTVFSVPSSEVA